MLQIPVVTIFTILLASLLSGCVAPVARDVPQSTSWPGISGLTGHDRTIRFPPIRGQGLQTFDLTVSEERTDGRPDHSFFLQGDKVIHVRHAHDHLYPGSLREDFSLAATGIASNLTRSGPRRPGEFAQCERSSTAPTDVVVLVAGDMGSYVSWRIVSLDRPGYPWYLSTFRALPEPQKVRFQFQRISEAQVARAKAWIRARE